MHDVVGVYGIIYHNSSVMGFFIHIVVPLGCATGGPLVTGECTIMMGVICNTKCLILRKFSQYALPFYFRSFYKSYYPHNEYMEVFGVEVVSHALILPQGSLIGQ